MARVFISHSSRDNESAARIKVWLEGQGFEAPFLDFDKHSGIPPGADWEKTLYREIEQSQAIVIIQTPNWMASKWCFAEFTQARALGKPVFPIIETPTGDTLIAPDIQALDLLKDREGGLKQLARELTRIALDAQGGFSFESGRPPYPGLLAFQEEDAAIYFGRDDDIRRLIERLNARRAQGGAKLLALLGASGSGKSSLLRAGVVPRLKRDRRNWIVLPPMRPQAHPVDELARVFAVALNQGNDWRNLRDQIVGDGLANALSDLASDIRMAAEANEAQILISIDQAEELFGTTQPDAAARFFKILNTVLSDDLPYLAIFAQRSDYLQKLQSAENLTVRFEEFSISPMPLARIPQIIEGPARVVSLGVEEGLVLQAAKDAETEDALPLLAFALRELYDRFANDNFLSLDEYHALGDRHEDLSPLENAVRKSADDVVDDMRPGEEELRALRDAFVPAMVRVNERGDFVRQPAKWNDLPAKSFPLLERLANARLLIIRQDGDDRIVEVAHEALLRKWPRLNEWLDEAREFLTGKQQLERDLLDWARVGEADRTSALLTGLKLNRARTWLSERPHQLTEDERQYIQASIDHFDAEERRKARMRRTVTFVSLAAAVVASVLATFAYLAEQRAVNALRAGTETAEKMVLDLAREFRDQEGVSADLVSEILGRALALQRRLTELGGNSDRLQNGISSALSEAALTYLQIGTTDEGVRTAYEAATEARNIILPIYEGEPENPEWAISLVRADIALGDSLLRLGDLEAATSHFHEGLVIAEKMAERDPTDFATQRELALILNRVADSLAPSGQTEEALAHYERSRTLRESLLKDVLEHPDDRRQDLILIRRDLVISNAKIGDILYGAGRTNEAFALYEESLILRQDIVKMEPENTLYQRDLAAGFQRLGAIEFRAPRWNFDQALSFFKQSLQIQEGLSKRDPSRLDWQFDVSISQENIADTYLELDRFSEANTAMEGVVSTRERLVASDPNNQNWLQSLATAYRKMGAIHHRSGNRNRAVESLKRATEIGRGLVENAPDNVPIRLDLVRALIQLSEAGDSPKTNLEDALSIVEELKLAGALPEELGEWPSDIRARLEQLPR